MVIPHERTVTIMCRGDGSYEPHAVTAVFVDDKSKQADTVSRFPDGWKCQIDTAAHPVSVSVGDYVAPGEVQGAMTAAECIRAGFHQVTSVVEREAPVKGFPYAKVVELS